MSSLLEHLGRDTLPGPMVEAFVAWCIWEQARPALSRVLSATGQALSAEEVAAAHDLPALIDASKRSGERAHAARNEPNPVGLATAEAASFLVHKIARTATTAEWDPEGVAFFSAQVVGWAVFAEVGLAEPTRKSEAESQAIAAQEAYLRELWHKLGNLDEPIE